MRSLFHKTREALECGARLAAITCLMCAIAGATTAVGAQTDAIVRVGRLPPAHARQTDGGAISPDGQWFAYTVVIGRVRQIWLLNLASGETRLLTPQATGDNGAVSWSPDGRRLAYVKDARQVRVVGVDGDSDRGVFAFTDRVPYRALTRTGWVGPDTVVFVGTPRYYMQPGPRPRPAFYRLALDGDTVPIVRADTVPGRASARVCCGRSRMGLWIEATAAQSARCVAGPLPHGEGGLRWVVSDAAVYFTTGDSLYTAGLRDGAAHRVAEVPSGITSLSMSTGGTIALTTRAPHDSQADLWLLRPPLAVTGDSLSRCPEPPEAVVRFVTANVPRWVSIAVGAEIPDRDFRVFSVDVGNCGDVDCVRSGVQYGDRLGWLTDNWERPDGSAQSFQMRPTDRALFGPPFDSVMASLGPSVAQLWRTMLAGQRAASPDDLVALARAHPDLAPVIAQNPALLPPSLSRDRLLDIGTMNGDMALAVLKLPRIQADPSATLAIAHSPQVWPDRAAQDVADGALAAHAVLIIQDPQTVEPVLFAIAAGPMVPLPAYCALMLEQPYAQRSPRLLAMIALRCGGSDAAVRARERLAALGTTVDAELTGIVLSARREGVSQNVLFEILMNASRTHPVHAEALNALAMLTDSAYAGVRASARSAGYPRR